MKKSSKTIRKAVKKAMLCLCMAFVMTLTVIAAPVLSASAGGASSAPSFTAGNQQVFYWNAGSSCYLEVTAPRTGFYEVAVTDNLRTGRIDAYLTSRDGMGYDSLTVDYSETGVYISSMVCYMMAGVTYEFYCYNYDATDESYLSGNINLRIGHAEYSGFTPTTISESNVNVALGEVSSWLQYTPTSTGQYCLNFDNIGAYITVYDASYGNVVEWYRDTEYLTEDGWQRRGKLVFDLEANRKYYFSVQNYGNETSSDFSITKNSLTVTNMLPEDCLYAIDSWWYAYDIGNHTFSYRVYYSNNTQDVLTASEINLAGYETPEVNYMGNSADVNGEQLLTAGYQSIVFTYNDVQTLLYLDIESITDWLIYEMDAAVSDSYVLENPGHTDEGVYYWRLKVDTTGFYEFYSEDLDLLQYNNLEIIDNRNNIVNFNEAAGGYPLVAGQEYAISGRCTFNSNTYDDFYFYHDMVTDNAFPDTASSGWYHDAVTYAVGRGTLKGYGSGYFGTADGIQRQDFLVMLARFDDAWLEDYEDMDSFSDVGIGSYYEAAVNWGSENRITTGYQDGRFGVGDMITREQLVTFLYRYAAYRGVDTTVDVNAVIKASAYPDFEQVSPFAQEAVIWAIDRGVISGKSGYIAPQGLAQRCEVAQIMFNIQKSEIF